MPVANFKFPGPASLLLEGSHYQQKNSQTILMTHPHPLMGGTMAHPVLHHLNKFYTTKGYSTFRFNFRGAGLSQGNHDNGKGEIDDICAAIHYLQKHGAGPIVLVGYSFGALTGLVAAHREMIQGYAGLALPTEPPYVTTKMLKEFPEIKIPCCFVAGSEDKISSLEPLKKHLKGNPALMEFFSLKGQDHFFQNRVHLQEMVQLLGEKTLTYFAPDPN